MNSQKFRTIIKVSMILLATGVLAACGSGSGGTASPLINQGTNEVNNNKAAISAYSIDGYQGTITGESIVVFMPETTKVKSLTATFTATAGANVTVNGVTQVSGTTPNDFSTPVKYTVDAANGSTATYTVTVAKHRSQDPVMLSYYLTSPSGYTVNGGTGIINGKDISVILPNGTNLNGLKASFTTTSGGMLYELAPSGAILQTSGVTQNNFTIPVNYMLLDGITTNNPYSHMSTYTVTVTTAESGAHQLMTFSLNGYQGTFSGESVLNGESISVVVPYGTNLESAVATFTAQGGSVLASGKAQISGTTQIDKTGAPINFGSPVTYTVFADQSDSNGNSYKVNVTQASKSANDITAFALNGVPATINGDNITVSLPSAGYSPDYMVPTFTTTGQSVVNANTNVTQISGQSVDDFSKPVKFVVTAYNGAQYTYTVNVVLTDN